MESRTPLIGQSVKKIYGQLRNDKSSVGVVQDQLVFKCVTPVLISIFARHAEIKIRRFKSC